MKLEKGVALISSLYRCTYKICREMLTEIGEIDMGELK